MSRARASSAGRSDLFGELGCFCGFETALTCEGSGPAGGQLGIEYRNPEVDYSSPLGLHFDDDFDEALLDGRGGTAVRVDDGQLAVDLDELVEPYSLLADKPPLPRAEPAGAPAIAEVSAAADEPSTPPAPAPRPPKTGARVRAIWRKITGGGDVA